jgi:hypothetical protein
MSKCINCGNDFTLKNKETRCDTCKEIVGFYCWCCKKPFEVIDEKGNKIKECKYCGFFKCPECNMCGEKCPTPEYKKQIYKLLITPPKLFDITENETREVIRNKINLIINFFENMIVTYQRKMCHRNVPISYAKQRIKYALSRMRNELCKNKEDQDKFLARFNKIKNTQIGCDFNLTQIRENGEYGQEYKDLLNACVCLGLLEIEQKKTYTNKGQIKRKYWSYKRINGLPCEFYLGDNNLIIKKCNNNLCENFKVGGYVSTSDLFCPFCGNKDLEIKITNRNICQLERCSFKESGCE